EDHVGNLDGYLAKMTGTYEGSSSITLVSRPREAEETPTHIGRTTHGAPLSIPISAKFQERAGRFVHVLPSMAGAQQISGTWDGTYMGLKWNIDFKVSGNTVSAVLKIYSPSGNEDIHHCEGTVREDGYVDASDNQGFRFTGRLTEDFRIVGTVTMKNGKSINLDIPAE
ncbi:MAG: hypothetical protein ACP5M0_15790, partial [Desulfomonilaceae bacterium]